jgi:hypothetical protein
MKSTHCEATETTLVLQAMAEFPPSIKCGPWAPGASDGRAPSAFLLLVRARLANYRLESFFAPFAAAFDFALPF